MKKQCSAIAGIAAITILLSGCSILSAIPGLGGPDPRCAVIEAALADEIDSGKFEAFDMADADLPGAAKLPVATCGYQFTLKGEESAAGYFGFYLTKDDAREDAVGEALTSAGYADGGGDEGASHLWSSPPSGDSGSHVIVSLSSIKDAGLEGNEEFLEALGTTGDIIAVSFV